MSYDKILTRTCRWCGETFLTTRADAQYCSAVHRQAALRWRKRLPEQLKRCLRSLDVLADYLVYPDAKAQAVKALSKVTAEIDETYRKFNIKRVR